MPKEFWKIVGVVTLVMICGMLGIVVWQQRAELEDLRSTAGNTRLLIETNTTELARLKAELDAAKAEADALAKAKEEITEAQSQLEKDMRTALESKDVTISELKGQLTVNILDQVLFDSGEAELKPEGQQVLRKIAAVLQQAPGRQIHVVGHTDNVPIRGGRGRFASNWELSSGRALAAVRFLQEQCGIDPRRLGALGHGEFRPIAANETAEGRARNRRIEVVVLPEAMTKAEGQRPKE
jgi:chemotaxis protein MotB